MKVKVVNDGEVGISPKFVVDQFNNLYYKIYMEESGVQIKGVFIFTVFILKFLWHTNKSVQLSLNVML